MGKREDKKREAEADKLAKLVDVFCREHGKISYDSRPGPLIPSTPELVYYSLNTKAGTLEVSTSSRSPTIFCCFDKPDEARKLGLLFLNPYSGKWNWHGNDAKTIFEEWRKKVLDILE